MRCVIMQHTFNPWLGYFSLIDSADIFVFLDDVQLSKQSWQTRNKIKTKDGELIVSIPVRHSGRYEDQLIKDTPIVDYEHFATKTLKSLQQNYSKAPAFKEVFPFLVDYFGSYLSYDQVRLGDFNANLIVSLSAKIGLSHLKFRNLSTCIANGLPVTGDKDQRLVSICKAFECDHYLSPQGSSAYLEHDNPGGAFEGSGITLEYQHFEHPTYFQRHGEFLPFMGVFDLLLNEGYKDALTIIRQGHRPSYSVEEFRTLKGLSNGKA